MVVSAWNTRDSVVQQLSWGQVSTLLRQGRLSSHLITAVPTAK
jgi:hypothetical protein